MGDPKTVLEGSVKYRDKKKWKSRWAVVSKLSPVADCLHIQLYRDSKERCKNGPTKASLSLEEFLGMETGFTLDKESNTMALICSELVVVLAFDNRELLIQWQVKIRANLVEEQQFLVQIAHVPTKSKLPCGPARLHLQDHTFCLVSGVPPRLLGTWPIKELRRFGVVEGKFCFEGGSLCGRGEGLHVLLTNQSSDLAQAMDLASKGKLLGKRKTLSRKNSVLESSTRIPLHKRNHHDSSKSTTSDSHRLLLSSGSESSTCDACSEILRSADPCGEDCLVYTSSGSSIKASSCRIHYRWPSCLSRWGQSSTTTTSDVESMDTVSVTLSDFQGPSTMSKSNGHGQSLSCLCDSQGTWPFNQCTKCGRQFYSRNSLQSCRNKQIPSPENGINEATNGFSPHWTMDSLVGSTNDCQSKKDGSYQMMNPPSDRASLCSHASHSSSASVASSSGSEYSVPRNYLETLYDRPKSVQHALNGVSSCKSAEPRRTNSVNEKPFYNNPPESCILCPCHEPIKDWVNSTVSSSQEKLVGSQECACWNKLSMSLRSEVDIRMINGRKSASANASPNSSPKKAKYGSGASTLRHNNSSLECDLTCTCGKSDPYANYAIPKSAMVHLKDMQQSSAQLNGSKDCKMSAAAPPTEDYDVPKKFTDLLSNCDMTQKTPAMKTVANGPSCSCMSACKIVQNIELFKMASKHSYNNHKANNHPSTAADALQMCACQRVMLWAGSLVPCLGPQRQSLETGWQCAKSLTTDGKNCPRTWYNTSSAVCSEPPKTAEAMVVNGKVKHIIRGASVDTDTNRYQAMSPVSRPRSSTVSYPLSCIQRDDDKSFNYANLEFPKESRTVKVTDEPSTVNYANIEFAETLPLYENSNLVLSRLEGDGGANLEPIVTDKPPLPPRSYPNSGSPKDGADKEEKCKCVRRSPKRVPMPLKQTNSGAYEMMCYEKNPDENGDEDYLLMQPLCSSTKDEKTSPSKLAQNDATQFSEEFLEKQGNLIREAESETEPEELPLRPFMPYSYPNSERNGGSAQEGNSVEILSRKNQLINEELQLRAMRSNSLSELKKKVLMRKRSSSVDGKNNGYSNKNDSSADVESLPASPVCSPRINSVQRKHSLFSKLNLRSKEKSMSTNEIVPTVVLPHDGASSPLNGAHKNGLHRSADCLKLNEEYGNSDDELNSDNSDFGVQKDSVGGPVMKRSSSVPCRAGMPTTAMTSPVRTHGTIMELNDLNKDCAHESSAENNVDNCKDVVQRKYSLDSHERPKKRTPYGLKPSCDNMYRQECLDECDTVMEMQGVLRRNRVHSNTSNDREAMVENYRSATSSCSSSDISDYMESLSFISRSSSSSSGSTSSADYVRAEDLYLLRTMPKPPLKSTFVPSNNITVPSVHQSRHSGVEIINGVSNHHHHRSNVDESSSAGTSSSSSYHDKPCCPVKDELKLRPCGSSNPSSNRDSRSSTSSTSSLSTSPSVTDYSSSTSSSSPPCQNNLSVRQAQSNGKCLPDSLPVEDTNKPVMQQQNMFVYPPSSKDEPRKT